ncbi:MAG TPA: deoxyribonuclease IV [Candidatus Marinimicrobia bacterium]|nr:deoxyribonuclease IV [Candidatus Neomarinimicrobiota bacterium]HQH55494.1 deoxyribonuclease IV [Candidatus Neomarinimicrobiota bacterium]HQK11100.1 deoxyribonuclease IV [Candidatus Neomarinimicrobiota bacterium]
MPYLGCHVSIENSLEKAPERGRELGCDAIQIFTSNQMQWKGVPVADETAEKFLNYQAEHKIAIVIAHDSYLVNLASPEPVKLAMSRKAFIEEIRRSQALKIPYIVFHPGSHMGAGVDFALRKIAESLDYAIEKTPDCRPMFLLETTAGQGTNVGNAFEELRQIIDFSAHPERLGVCFDTCHAYAAGYDLVSPAKYDETFARFDDVIGLSQLKCFHLNDSKKPLGSRVDRHANLGDGFLGWEVFYRLINDDRFGNLPMILETPGGDENFAKEIASLKKALEKK